MKEFIENDVLVVLEFDNEITNRTCNTIKNSITFNKKKKSVKKVIMDLSKVKKIDSEGLSFLMSYLSKDYEIIIENLNYKALKKGLSY